LEQLVDLEAPVLLVQLLEDILFPEVPVGPE